MIGFCLRLDESLPFVFVDVLRSVANRATHFQEPRAEAFEAPRSYREPGHAQSSRNLDVGQGSLVGRRERIPQSYIVSSVNVGHHVLRTGFAR
jgi:hypothetical protein